MCNTIFRKVLIKTWKFFKRNITIIITFLIHWLPESNKTLPSYCKRITWFKKLFVFTTCNRNTCSNIKNIISSWDIRVPIHKLKCTYYVYRCPCKCTFEQLSLVKISAEDVFSDILLTCISTLDSYSILRRNPTLPAIVFQVKRHKLFLMINGSKVNEMFMRN